MNIKRFVNVYLDWLNWKMSAKLTSAIINVTLCSITALAFVYYLIETRETTERLGAQWTTLGTEILSNNLENVQQEAKLLQTLARTPSLVDAVKKANLERSHWPADTISKQDQAWAAKEPNLASFVNGIASNATSAYLVDFQKANPEEAEVFVTDSKGLNVAMTNRTSDFLQSDEEWWRATFHGGEGAIYYGPVALDDSSNTYAMDIGVPVRDPDTDQVIGVLRGTLDASLLFHALESTNVGAGGDILLLTGDGHILYSQMPSHFMKPAPQNLLALFDSNPSGWTRSVDLHGNPAFVAYTSLEPEKDNFLGWRLLVTQEWSRVNKDRIDRLLISALAGVLVAIIGTMLCLLILRHSIIRPIVRLTQAAHELSLGNILHQDASSRQQLGQRKDEVGEISRAFDRLTQYFLTAADAATCIANKNLNFSVTPNSEHDELGNAFAHMVTGLRSLLSLIATNAETLSTAATQLATSSDESGKVTNQIATTIHQVASGINQQAEQVSKTSGSIERMGQVIHKVTEGAQEQAKTINMASQATGLINAAIEHVVSSTEAGVKGVAQATQVAQTASQTVKTAIVGMQTIKTKVGLSMQKVREMGTRSEEIDSIVETIEDIAAQTNLLALNAAIEAARVESKGEKTVESLLQQHLLGVAGLVSAILSAGRELDANDLVDLARLARVTDLCVSDSDGVVIASSQPGSIGFRFSEDAHHQSSAFRPLLQRRDGIVIRPITMRDQDGKPYIYVGISRRDRAGIIQAGTAAELVYSLSGYSRGFAVVASEVGKLAEHAKASTKEIAVLIRDLQKTVNESILVMEDGVRDVDNGSAQAIEAGTSLAAILDAVESIRGQVSGIASTIQHINTAYKELVGAMETVGVIVQKNNNATVEMTEHSSELIRAAENIASVSEQNGAAVEEVSASTEEVLAQVEQVSASAASLMTMAQDLQQIVAEFALHQAESSQAA